MLNIVSITVAFSIFAVLIGIIIQKEIFSRILLLNSLGNLVILMIVTLGSYKYNESYIDIALIYASLSFVAMMAVFRFIEYRNKT